MSTDIGSVLASLWQSTGIFVFVLILLGILYYIWQEFRSITKSYIELAKENAVLSAKMIEVVESTQEAIKEAHEMATQNRDSFQQSQVVQTRLVDRIEEFLRRNNH